MQVLLDFARRRHRLAQVAQGLAGGVKLSLALLLPVLDHDVVGAAVALVRVQLVGGVHRHRVLHVLEEFLVVYDVAVVLVVAVEPVGAADGLEEVVVAQFVVQVDVRAGRGVEARQELADHDQEL